MKKPISKIIIIIIALVVISLVVWHFWLGDFLKKTKAISTASNWEFPGYEKGAVKVDKEETSVSYKPKENKEENIQRVVGNVAVRVKTYPTSEEARKQIEDASSVYIWEWRKEEILDHQFEVSTGFLFNPQERRYTAAYLAWTEGLAYYEFIATPSDIRDYSDKEFLYQSAKEVAEGILSK